VGGHLDGLSETADGGGAYVVWAAVDKPCPCKCRMINFCAARFAQREGCEVCQRGKDFAQEEGREVCRKREEYKREEILHRRRRRRRRRKFRRGVRCAERGMCTKGRKMCTGGGA